MRIVQKCDEKTERETNFVGQMLWPSMKEYYEKQKDV